MVVSDAGPLIHLSQIGKLWLLERLFGEALVTARVKVEAFDEGVRLGCADAGLIGKALDESWLKVVVVPERLAKTAAKLAAGESVSLADAETLLLAKDKKSELLVDEKVLSDLTKMYGLRVWGTWTVLLESLSRGLIEVADMEGAVDELGKKRHKLKKKQAAQILDAAKHVAAMRTKRKKTKS